MILVDANLLIYAHVSTFSQHGVARAWLDGRLNGVAPVGLPWSSLLAFLRLTTNPRVFERPESMPDAWRQALAWLAAERTWIPQPTERHRGHKTRAGACRCGSRSGNSYQPSPH